MQHIIIAKEDKELGLIAIIAIDEQGNEVDMKTVKEAVADYSLIEWRLNYIAGKLLTQADATFSDPIQRKAQKDLIRNLIADEFGYFSNLLSKGLIDQSLEQFNDMTEEEWKEWNRAHPQVSIDEVVLPGK